MRQPDEILRALLEIRGICSPEDISEFLSDKPKKTYDPFLLPDMGAGVDLLLSEINKGTKICIYGDYDADGVTSICILSHVFSMLTGNFTYYIPSRFNEGYGLNKSAIKKIYDEGTGLLITVDCGSVSYEEVEYAKGLGMKIIVTDHHSIEDVKADCILINPKRKDCIYPFRELAGCGVAFKLAQAIQQRAGLPKKVINDVLDLAAVGTVGDVVSLKDENRTIVKYGLNVINSGRRLQLKRLTDAISLRWVSSENIAFGIAPHINAAGRMTTANEAAELFLSTDDEIISKQVDRLVYLNSERKKKQEAAYKLGMEMVDGNENFIVLLMEDIHEGIAGIVAGKIKESIKRPVIILTHSGEGLLKGTGRSIDNVDIYALLKKHENLFLRFGGHKSACGFLMKDENFDALKAGLEKDVSDMLTDNPELFNQGQIWELELEPEEITAGLAKELMKLEPVGQDNPKPVFIMKNVIISQSVFMGQDKAHARFFAQSPGGNKVECVLFKKAQEMKNVLFGNERVDVTGIIDLQKWNGRERIQFIVEEILV